MTLVTWSETDRLCQVKIFIHLNRFVVSKNAALCSYTEQHEWRAADVVRYGHVGSVVDHPVDEFGVLADARPVQRRRAGVVTPVVGRAEATQLLHWV